MKVILTQDIKTLGKKDDIKEVNDGYAKNFLIPKGLALEANAGNLNVVSSKKEAENLKKQKELESANKLAKSLENIKVVIKTKVGEGDRLFGSITSKDICEKIKKDFNLDIEKRKIELSDPIKTLGTTIVNAKLYPGVTAKINVRIERE